MLKEAFYKGFGAAAQKFIKRHGIESLGKKNAVKLVKNVGEHSGASDSLFLWPVKALTKKIVGERRFDRLGHSINKAILNADTIGGKPLHHLASKLDTTKNLFKQTEHIPVAKDVYKKIHRTSLTAPLGKARDFAVPMIASSAVYSKLQDRRNAKAQRELIQ